VRVRYERHGHYNDGPKPSGSYLSLRFRHASTKIEAMTNIEAMILSTAAVVISMETPPL